MSSNNWFSHPPGSTLLFQEIAALERVFETRRGTDLLQIGGPDDLRLIKNAKVFRSFLLDDKHHAHPVKPFIRSQLEALPIQSESMDIVLLMHVLETTKHPGTVLQEAYRVLRPNGLLIVLGWNPFGVWRLFQQRIPHHNRYYAASKIKRYLRKARFEVTSHDTICFRPPVQNEALAEKYQWLETVGQLLMPYAGAVYLLTATKNMSGVTPLLVNGFQSARVCDIKSI